MNRRDTQLGGAARQAPASHSRRDGEETTPLPRTSLELWLHFGSAEAVNDALRHVIAERKKASGS